MTILRLPNNNTRWVWEIDAEHSRILIEVVEVRWNGEEWWVTTRTLPDHRIGIGRLGDTFGNELDRFWEAVTPVGGRLEDLSNPIDESQYRPVKGIDA